MNKETAVAVLGASPKEERYSNQAVKLLLDTGYEVIPVNPAGMEIHGITSVRSLADIDLPVDTLTVYVNSRRSDEMTEEILNLAPRRIIFNPGAENDRLAEECERAGIKVENACTLVLLNTEQF